MCASVGIRDKKRSRWDRCIGLFRMLEANEMKDRQESERCYQSGCLGARIEPHPQIPASSLTVDDRPYRVWAIYPANAFT